MWGFLRKMKETVLTAVDVIGEKTDEVIKVVADQLVVPEVKNKLQQYHAIEDGVQQEADQVEDLNDLQEKMLATAKEELAALERERERKMKELVTLMRLKNPEAVANLSPTLSDAESKELSEKNKELIIAYATSSSLSEEHQSHLKKYDAEFESLQRKILPEKTKIRFQKTESAESLLSPEVLAQTFFKATTHITVDPVIQPKQAMNLL